jgi:hypothetical protein
VLDVNSLINTKIIKAIVSHVLDKLVKVIELKRVQQSYHVLVFSSAQLVHASWPVILFEIMEMTQRKTFKMIFCCLSEFS